MKIFRANPEKDGWGGFTADQLADPNPLSSLQILRAIRGLADAQERDMLLLPDGTKVLPYFEIGDRVKFAEPLDENSSFDEIGKTGVVTGYSPNECVNGWQLNYYVRADEVGHSELLGEGCYRGYQLELVKRGDNPPFWRRGHDLAFAEHKAWLLANHPEWTHKMWLLANYPEHPGNLRPIPTSEAVNDFLKTQEHFINVEEPKQPCTLDEYRTEVKSRRLLGPSNPSAFDHALGQWLDSISPEEFAAWDRKESAMHKRLEDLGFLPTFETHDEMTARHSAMSRPAIMREMRETLEKVGISPSVEDMEQLYAANWLRRVMRRVYRSLKKSDTG